jgi:hypothetical protein
MIKDYGYGKLIMAIACQLGMSGSIIAIIWKNKSNATET